jgi:hypothetical protein
LNEALCTGQFDCISNLVKVVGKDDLLRLTERFDIILVNPQLKVVLVFDNIHDEPPIWTLRGLDDTLNIW